MSKITSIIVASAVASVMIPATASATPGYVRADGIVFDSDVGAACGALHTDVLFEPWGTSIDALDEPVLDFIAECMRDGALAAARVAVIGLGDASYLQPSGEALARDRMNAVRDALLARGVDARQLDPWALAVAWEPGERKPDRVVFRVLEGGPSWVLR